MQNKRESANTETTAALTRVYAWFSAIVSNDQALMQDLLTHGLPVDVPHPLRHTTALMEATRLGRTELVTWLLSHGAAPAFLCGLPRGTPLHCAIKRQQWSIAEQLVEATPQCHVIDHYSRTPLHTLALEAPSDMATLRHVLLLAESLLKKHCPIDALDHEGVTALHYCAINDLPALAQLLLDHHANPNIVAPDTKVSPLIIAALERNASMAQLLLRYGADPLLTTKDGSTAFSIMPSLKRLDLNSDPLEEATFGKQANYKTARMVN